MTFPLAFRSNYLSVFGAFSNVATKTLVPWNQEFRFSDVALKNLSCIVAHWHLLVASSWYEPTLNQHWTNYSSSIGYVYAIQISTEVHLNMVQFIYAVVSWKSAHRQCTVQEGVGTLLSVSTFIYERASMSVVPHHLCSSTSYYAWVESIGLEVLIFLRDCHAVSWPL